MSYARSPRPSLLMTVGTMFVRLPPCVETDWWFWPGRRICHRQVRADDAHAARPTERQRRDNKPGLGRRICPRRVRAEVGHAAQRLERQRRGGKPELDGRILRPGSLLGVRAD